MSPRNTKLSIYTEPAIFDSRAKDANVALQNPAVARCCQAWQHAYQEYAENDESEIGARGWACKAYRNAMPVLSGEESVGDYIACVSHGLLIGAIQEHRASKLLYAVQVALSTFNRAGALAGKRHTPYPPPPEPQQTVENVENKKPVRPQENPVTITNKTA